MKDQKRRWVSVGPSSAALPELTIAKLTKNPELSARYALYPLINIAIPVCMGHDSF